MIDLVNPFFLTLNNSEFVCRRFQKTVLQKNLHLVLIVQYNHMSLEGTLGIITTIDGLQRNQAYALIDGIAIMQALSITILSVFAKL